MTNIKEHKTVAFVTLGCKLNFSETTSLSRIFNDYGFTTINAKEIADVYVVNTCSVTGQAEKKCRNAIQKLIRQAPQSSVVVTGCYAQLRSSELAAIEGVDLVLGMNEKFAIIEYLDKYFKHEHNDVCVSDISKTKAFSHAWSTDERTRSFLKVQDGCDYFCSYCTIPFARGRSRNAPINEIVKQAEEIIKTGVPEIVLTGVNIGDYGKSTNNNFYELVKALDQIDANIRFRISSIEPDLLNEQIIKLVANSKKFAPHFHIPLQAANDKILTLMGRKYTLELFKQRIETIKKTIPDAGIGIDIIVGFPGESDDDFNEAMQFLTQLHFSYLHVFSFSSRPGTKADKMPDKVHPQKKLERSKQLIELSNQKRNDFYKQSLGKNEIVIFESKSKNNQMTGFTGNYIKIQQAYNKNLIGKQTPIILNGNIENDVLFIES
jgi:threonylcarbamoyladenosine tRNA methylthiotransferase MtaB